MGNQVEIGFLRKEHSNNAIAVLQGALVLRGIWPCKIGLDMKFVGNFHMLAESLVIIKCDGFELLEFRKFCYQFACNLFGILTLQFLDSCNKGRAVGCNQKSRSMRS